MVVTGLEVSLSGQPGRGISTFLPCLDMPRGMWGNLGTSAAVWTVESELPSKCFPIRPRCREVVTGYLGEGVGDGQGEVEAGSWEEMATTITVRSREGTVNIL